MPAMPILQASVFTIKLLLKSGIARIGADISACLSASKEASCAGPKGSPLCAFLVNLMIGAASVE